MEYICRAWGKQIKIIGWFLEMEKKKKSPRRLKFNTVQTVVIGFFGVILGGGILLSLPICNQKPIEFIDALFTSVSSVCVTGLVTIVPAEQFTLLGKIILLLLIQVGGLGVIACMSAFFPSFSLYFHYSQYTNLFLQMQENYKNVTISLYFRNFS